MEPVPESKRPKEQYFVRMKKKTPLGGKDKILDRWVNHFRE